MRVKKNTESKVKDKKMKIDEKLIQARINELKNNKIRKTSEWISPLLKKWIGAYYGSLHLLIMGCCSTILLLDNNIYHLIVLLNIVAIDCVSCIFLHDCPLTILEQKYLGQSIVGTRLAMIKYVDVMYKCDHIYERTIEFLTNIVSLLVGKIGILIVVKIFDIKFTSV